MTVECGGQIFPSARRAGPGIALAIAIAIGVNTAPTLASDYSHVCRTADGTYVIEDDVLYRSVDAGTPGSEITFKRLSETLLKRETGYCVVNKTGGQRFNYEAKTYTLRIAFKDGEQSIEVDALCEMASDGLPAAYTCDRQVVVSKVGGTESNPAPATGGTKVWMHNGSVMRLEANGDERHFYYEEPRAGLRKQGAQPGSLLFKGTRDGSNYSGTAYIFKAGCDPEAYEVDGDVSGDDHTVTMVGKAPRLDNDCEINGTKDDTLVFTYVP
jgi:hypothetical protein